VWAKSVIEAGLALVFEPRSTVIHSHDDGAWAESKRIYLDHANLYELFGVLTVPTFSDARRNAKAQFEVYRAQVAGLGLTPPQRDAQLAFARRLAYGETFAQWLARALRPKRTSAGHLSLDRALGDGVIPRYFHGPTIAPARRLWGASGRNGTRPRLLADTRDAIRAARRHGRTALAWNL
jgi:hypothetical protein